MKSYHISLLLSILLNKAYILHAMESPAHNSSTHTIHILLSPNAVPSPSSPPNASSASDWIPYLSRPRFEGARATLEPLESSSSLSENLPPLARQQSMMSPENSFRALARHITTMHRIHQRELKDTLNQCRELCSHIERTQEQLNKDVIQCAALISNLAGNLNSSITHSTQLDD